MFRRLSTLMLRLLVLRCNAAAAEMLRSRARCATSLNHLRRRRAAYHLSLLRRLLRRLVAMTTILRHHLERPSALQMDVIAKITAINV